MIYFVQAGEAGPVKIGYCDDESKLPSRLCSLQIGNAELLTVRHAEDGGLDLEAHYHAELHQWAIRGEWFEADVLRLRRAVRQNWDFAAGVAVRRRAGERLRAEMFARL